MALDFSFKEYYVSNRANAKGIDNFPGVDSFKGTEFSFAKIKSNLQKVHYNIIDPLRKAFPPYTNAGNKDIWITSAYRCEALNNEVGGVTNSQHKYGLAIDIFSVSQKASLIWNWCYQNLPAYHQLIWEYPEFGDFVDGARDPLTWIHISYVEENNIKVNSIATQREDLHEMYKAEGTSRNGDYTHGIKIADQNLI
jgi:hypothetical protein